MSVFKIEKNKNYTIMGNFHLRDKNLSYKAKGLLSFMLSLPDDWDYSMRGLESLSKESIKAIRNILQELEDNKYLVRVRKQDEFGKFYYDYSIYEIPFDSNPYYQKGYVVKGNAGNGTQINTNLINTNNKEDKIDKTKSNNFLTGELLLLKYINEDDNKLCLYDELFQELLKYHSYHKLMIIIHYIVPRVVKRNFEDEDGNITKNKYGYFKTSIESNIHKLNNPIENLWDFDEDLFNDSYSDYSK